MFVVYSLGDMNGPTDHRNDWSLLQFLWDKWKHSNSLLFQRQGTWWLAQSAILVTVAFVWQTDLNLGWKYGISGGLLILISVFGFLTVKMVDADMRVRNGFNLKIVELLRTLSVSLRGITDLDESKTQCWDPSNTKHPVNLWHTGEPLREGKGTRASGYAKFIIFILAIIELLASFPFFIWLAFWL